MSKLWDSLVRPLMFRIDAERAHDLGMMALRCGLADRMGLAGSECEDVSAAFGPISRFGLTFENPIGLAAGFDKNCLAVPQLASLGFGSVEVGTITYDPQPGNPKPRIFRLPEQRAIINRLGFNNDGAVKIAGRLQQLPRLRYVIGANIGRNKDVPNDNAIDNYLTTFDLVSPHADYVTVNVSSPNTPNLRDLQGAQHLERLISGIQLRNGGRKPVLLKIAPDLDEEEIGLIVDICFRHSIAGIVATNTTISREGIPVEEAERIGAGGLSGRPLADKATRVISAIFRLTDGKIPIVGVGGVLSAEDAFRKIAAGASLIQVYTGFVYGGPSFPRDLTAGLADILRAEGFTSLDEAVGSGITI